MNKVFIYALTEPGDENQIRYIGKTNNIKNRFRQHLKEPFLENKNKNSYKNNWIRKIMIQGLKPNIIILDEVSNKEWEFWETYYVDLYKSWGFKLTNLAIPGKGGRLSSDFTKEIKEKLRKIYYNNNKHKLGEYNNWIKQVEIDKIKKQKLKKAREIIAINSKTGKYFKTFTSISEASEILNINPRRIGEVMSIRNKRKSYKGMIFIKANSYNKNKDYKVKYCRKFKYS